MRSIALVLSLVGLFGCVAGDDDAKQKSVGGDPGEVSGGAAGGGLNLNPQTEGPTNGCTTAATLVYVLSEAGDLYSFAPGDKLFTKIGHLGCQTSMIPNSMAVDRNATAWVNYVASDPKRGDTAGGIFKVSTQDASCESTSISLQEGWFRVGMGFSLNGTAGNEETLFVAGIPSNPGVQGGAGLGRIDFGAMAVVPVGHFDGTFSGQRAELTGTGDGRLFGFFTMFPVELATIDKASGSILSANPLYQVETPSAWAVSFWGGDIYLYTAPSPMLDPSRTTNVTRYRPSDSSVDTAYMTDIGFTIVGAGVSTCAPVDSPK
jgi:hypothetical protein